MAKVPRHKRFVLRESHGGDPKIVLSDLVINSVVLQGRTETCVFRNDRLGIPDGLTERQKVSHQFLGMSGSLRTVPKFTQDDPRNAQREPGIVCGVLHGPALTAPKPDQKRGVGYGVHGSAFDGVRFSVAASNVSLPGS